MSLLKLNEEGIYQALNKAGKNFEDLFSAYIKNKHGKTIEQITNNPKQVHDSLKILFGSTTTELIWKLIEDACE